MFRVFFIMPIGLPDLDAIYADLKVCLETEFLDLELVVERIDQDNEGGLLKVEVLDAIEQCDLVVADLTYERPNCYLEVGYLMGHHRRVQSDRKWRRLILAARSDHLPDLPERKADQPKVHFDLSGYGILYWCDGDDYRRQLVERVRQRLSLLAPADPASLGEADDAVPSVPSPTAPPARARGGSVVAGAPLAVEGGWFLKQRTDLSAPLDSGGFIEMRAALPGLAPSALRPGELLRVARACSRKGWSIAHVYSREELRPRPMQNGIRAKVHIQDGEWAEHECWSLDATGRFYAIKSMIEDTIQVRDRELGPGQCIWYDARVYDHLAFFMHLDRLYRSLGAEDGDVVRFRIEHAGLSGRRLDASDTRRSYYVRSRYPAPTEVPNVVQAGQIRLGDLRDRHKLLDLVRRLCSPIFDVFDFAEFEDHEIEEIASSWLENNGYGA